MTVNPRYRKAILSSLIVLSIFSCVYVNSQYSICPVGYESATALFQEKIQQNEEKDNDFLSLPDLSLLQKAAGLIERLTRY